MVDGINQLSRFVAQQSASETQVRSARKDEESSERSATGTESDRVAQAPNQQVDRRKDGVGQLVNVEA